MHFVCNLDTFRCWFIYLLPQTEVFLLHKINALNCSLAYVLFCLQLSPLTYKSAYLLDCDLFEVREYERGIITLPLTLSPLYFAHCRCKNMVLVEWMNDYHCLEQRFCKWKEIVTCGSLAVFAPRGRRKPSTLGTRPESGSELFLLF